MSGNFIGDSDLGEISISYEKLKKMVFKQPPVENAKIRAASFTDTLILTDGLKISVANLRRRSWYNSTLWIPPQRTFSGYSNIRFLRGDSMVTLDFSKIKKLTFEPGKCVKLTLRNNSEITGKVPDQESVELLGFSGIYEEGLFFISPKKLQAIEFGN